MFRKKSLCKIHNIRNYFIVPISPIGSKFKAVARLFAALALALAVFFDMAISCSIGVILCMSSVRYNKNLYILKQPWRSPKTVSLITFNLIKRFSYSYAASLELHMNKRQTIYKYRYVIAGIAYAPVFFVLIDNLHSVIMYILLIKQINILYRAVIPA